MADRRRIVTMSSGGRPVLEIDLETGATFAAIKDTFAYSPGQQNQQASREPGRYGGSQVVGESNDNGTVSWQAFVRGATADVAAANVEALLQACNRTARDRLLEWRPDGVTYSSYFRIAGPAAWSPAYSWAQWKDGPGMVVTVTFPVRPLVLWDPMTIADDFSVDSLADYTFDAATSADVAVSGGALTPVVGAALTVERRARHTVRGYPLLEGQATLKATPGATIASFKAGVVLRGSAADTYIDIYVDDNGTSSRLRIDAVIAGVRTNRQSTNLAARVSNSTAFWVRGRVVGQAVSAEYWTTQPLFNGSDAAGLAPAAYTLTAGEQTSLVAGHAGVSWIPQNASATLDEFELRPFYRKALTTPVVTRYLDAIPGSAPALADFTAALGGTADGITKQFALIGWAQQSASTPNVAAVLDSSAANQGSGLTSGAQAGAYGGSDSRVTAAGAVSASLGWTIDHPLTADEFADDTVDVEVWARLVLSSTLVNPRATAQVLINGNSLRTVYTVDFGSTGRVLTPPSSGTVYRFTRLGVLTLPTNPSSLSVFVGVLCDTGSTGAIGIDFAELVPARRRAASPTAVSATGYPAFATSASSWVKVIYSDLAGALGADPLVPFAPAPDSGLGGSLIQPPAGPLDLLVDLHEMVPDDPTSSATSDPFGHQLTTTLDVVPRSYLLRSA